MKNLVKLFDAQESSRKDIYSVPLSDAADWVYMRGAISVPLENRHWPILQLKGLHIRIEGMFEGRYLTVVGRGRIYHDAVDGRERQYIYVGRAMPLPENGEVPGVGFEEIGEIGDEEREELEERLRGKGAARADRVDLSLLPPLKGTPRARLLGEKIRRRYFLRTDVKKAQAHVGRKYAVWWIRNKEKLIGEKKED